MNIKRFVIAISASLLLLTGCGENTLKKEDFNIDPNAETVNADTEALFNKVYNACKVETEAWYTANQNLFEGMDGLDTRIYQYNHFTYLYNEYLSLMPETTRNLVDGYKNNHYWRTTRMYDVSIDLNNRLNSDKNRFSSHANDIGKIKNDVLKIIDTSIPDEARGYDCYYDIFMNCTWLLREDYRTSYPRDDVYFSLAVSNYVIKTGLLITDLSPEDRSCYFAFRTTFKEEVEFAVNFFFSSVYSFYGYKWEGFGTTEWVV